MGVEIHRSARKHGIDDEMARGHATEDRVIRTSNNEGYMAGLFCEMLDADDSSIMRARLEGQRGRQHVLDYVGTTVWDALAKPSSTDYGSVYAMAPYEPPAYPEVVQIPLAEFFAQLDTILSRIPDPGVRRRALEIGQTPDRRGPLTADGRVPRWQQAPRREDDEYQVYRLSVCTSPFAPQQFLRRFSSLRSDHIETLLRYNDMEDPAQLRNATACRSLHNQWAESLGLDLWPT